MKDARQIQRTRDPKRSHRAKVATIQRKQARATKHALRGGGR